MPSAEDFFDYIDRTDGALVFALGDVAGKGPAAALLGALMQGSLAAEGSVGAAPAATITTVNSALVRRGIQGRFVTLFYAVLYPDGRLLYCNAGHNAPILVTKTGVDRLETGGMVVGLFDGVPFAEGTVNLQPDDYLVIFSDGVSEAMNAAGEEYGDERLLECLAGMSGDRVRATAAGDLHRCRAVHGRCSAARRHNGDGRSLSAAGFGRDVNTPQAHCRLNTHGPEPWPKSSLMTVASSLNRAAVVVVLRACHHPLER